MAHGGAAVLVSGGYGGGGGGGCGKIHSLTKTGPTLQHGTFVKDKT